MKKDENRKTIVLSGGNTTQPLTERLIGKYDVVIVEPQIAEAHAQKFGERVIPLGRFVDQALQHRAVNEAAKIFGHFADAGMATMFQCLEPLMALPQFKNSGFAKNIEEWMPAYIQTALSRQLVSFLALERLLPQKHVAMVVTHEDVTEMYGGLARWAKARGIPTMHVPHNNSFMQPDYSPDLHEHSISDCIAATPHEDDFYRMRGYDGEIRITGSPNFDRWFDYQKDKTWAQKLFRLNSEKPVIVYLTSWGQRTNANDDLSRFERGFDAMMQVTKEQDWQVIVSLHPGEAQGMEQNYANRANALGGRCIIVRHYFEIVLSAADLVVACAPSNALVDAAIMDVPSLSMKMIGFGVNHPAVREIEPDAELLTAEIIDALSDGGLTQWQTHRDDFIHRMAFQVDGHSADRIAAWISEKAN